MLHALLRSICKIPLLCFVVDKSIGPIGAFSNLLVLTVWEALGSKGIRGAEVHGEM